MRTVPQAVKASIEAFCAFITEAAGYKKDAKGNYIVDKKGNKVPVNGRGNISFTFDGIAFDTDEEMLTYCRENEIVLRDVLAATVNEAKGLALREAVQALEVPPTLEVNSATLAEYTKLAEVAGRTAADKTVRPSISERGQKQALEAQVDNLAAEAAKDAAAFASDPEKVAALIAATIGLKKLEK